MAVLAALAAPAPAAAQPLGAPAATVTAVTVADPSPSESRVLLAFGGALPTFSIASNDTPRIAITFNDARLAPGLSLPGGSHGPVQSIGALHNYGLMTLVISGVGPIHVTAQPTQRGAGLVSVTALGSADGARTSLPDAPQARPPSGDSDGDGDGGFEVVPLKYADVSEIVGLLTANQTTRPNDNFMPEEPAFGSAEPNREQ